ncbi:hypothetical protein TU82_01535 [Pseudomonas orientalis]|nr:hypothetical protein TU82_01535 [Pseudomonas orientalis]
MSVASAQSTRAATAELPFAIIEHAKDNSLLYPLDARLGTTAKLTLPAGSTRVIVHFAIKGQTCATFPPISVTSGDIADIPWQWISTCIGHTVLIWYEAVVGGVRKESLVLELEIQDVREEHLRSSMPEFANAEWDWGTLWLDMFELEGNATIRFEAWLMIRAGSRLFVAAAGNEENVPPLFHWVAFDHVVTEEEAHEGYVFEFELSRIWLARLNDYTSCTCHLGVIWDGCEPEAPVSSVNPLPRNAQDFHQRSTVLLRVDPALDLNPPRLREAVQISPGNWQVNPINTTQGGHVIVAYQGMTEGDRVCVQACGPDYGPVSLGCQDVKAGDVSLSFDCGPEIFAALFHKKLTLIYSVQFNNYMPQYSPECVIQVLGPRLTEPCIEEATAGIVDLNIDSVTGVVPVWDYAKEGECCWMWVSGTREDGTDYRFDVLHDQPLTAQWLTNGVDTPIPRGELKKLADCTGFELHFAASFDGKCDRATAIEFPMQVFALSQEDLVLNAPTVIEAVDSELTAWNGREGVHVEVDYIGSNRNHTLSVCWTRPDGSCWRLATQPGSTAAPVSFFMPRGAVIESMGKTVKINFTVTSDCKMQTSDDLNLHISVPVRLPTPKVLQATPPATQRGIIDLRTFNADADVVVPRWWFMLAGQLGWLECSGKLWDGSIHTFAIMHAESFTVEDVANELSRKVKRQELEKYEIGTELTFTFKVTADGSSDAARMIGFPELKLILRKRLVDETFFDPNAKDWNGWQKGKGAADSRDLRRKTGLVPGGLTGWFLEDWGYTNTTDPNTQREKLFKVYTVLEVGRRYIFSAWVRDPDGNAASKPGLVLVAEGKDITPITYPAGTAWHLLEGEFVASSSTMRLAFHNAVMGIGPVNDFEVTYLTVKETV